MQKETESIKKRIGEVDRWRAGEWFGKGDEKLQTIFNKTVNKVG